MSEYESEKQRKKTRSILMTTVTVVFVASVAYLLTNTKETHVSEPYIDAKQSSLICVTEKASDLDFFNSNAPSFRHELKIVFNRDEISKMSYEFRGEYDSWATADRDEGILHAKYNNYMGEHGLNNTLLTPIFQNVEGKLRISLYLDNYEDMDPILARLFYIEEDAIKTIMENSVTKTKDYYENEGFSCIIGD